MAAAALALAAAAGCGKKDEIREAPVSEAARQDSARKVEQSLHDQGVTVDTQKIDTGGTRAAAVDDN